MRKPRFEMHICTEDGCVSLGKTTNEERAAKKVDRAVKRAAKRHIKGKPRRGVVKGSVTDDSGLVRYRAHEEYGAPEPKPRPRRRSRPEPAYAEPPFPGEE